jgi:hypothetical protein
MADRRHDSLRKMREDLLLSEEYIAYLHLAEYEKTLQLYLVGIVMLSLSLVPVAFIIRLCWLHRKKN